MFDLEFIMFPEEDDFRACYLTEELKIQFNMPYITDGYTDLIKCINHEFLHALIDWGLEDPLTDEPLRAFKNCYDPTGASDHYIMRSLNFD